MINIFTNSRILTFNKSYNFHQPTTHSQASKSTNYGYLSKKYKILHILYNTEIWNIFYQLVTFSHCFYSTNVYIITCLIHITKTSLSTHHIAQTGIKQYNQFINMIILGKFTPCKGDYLPWQMLNCQTRHKDHLNIMAICF